MCGGCGGNCGVSGGTCTAIYNTAREEMADMKQLNDRLAVYLTRLREMSIDSISNKDYMEAMRVLEDQISKLRQQYEKELMRLRANLAAAGKQNSELHAQIDHSRSTTDGLRATLAAETEKCARMSQDITDLQGQLANKDKEIANLKSQIGSFRLELDQIKPSHAVLGKENDELKRKLESELKERHGLGDKVKYLQDQSNFDTQSKQEHVRDLSDRLRASQDIIISLEKKIMVLTKSDNAETLSKMLKKLREANLAELQRYQQESERALNTSLGTFRSQLNDESKAREQLAKEKSTLENLVDNLSGKIHNLEGQLSAANKLNVTLQKSLAAQKAEACSKLAELERKLLEAQESMMSKAKECHGARDMQVALKTEIDNYRNLLDAGDATNINLTDSNKVRQVEFSASHTPRPPTGSRMIRPTSAAVGYKSGNASPDCNIYNSAKFGQGTTDNIPGYGDLTKRPNWDTTPPKSKRPAWARTTYTDAYCFSNGNKMFPNLQSYRKSTCGSANSFRPGSARVSHHLSMGY